MASKSLDGESQAESPVEDRSPGCEGTIAPTDVDRESYPDASRPSERRSAIILSFDVEEHDRIEAAAGLVISRELKSLYGDRVATMTYWLLDLLAEHEIKATFFVVGEVARRDPTLIRAMVRAGHEVASHGWDHRRVLEMTPETFHEDLRRSKDTLEQVTGQPIFGYRAPTFSIVRRTAWAIDVLTQSGILYDSSIYPVRHDRYGIAGAPRVPFVAQGIDGEILEFPPATWRIGGVNLPVGGGGYFRLLPLGFMERAIAQVGRDCRPPVTMLYFHPWEFDPEQPRLALRFTERLRTYAGITRTRGRLLTLLRRHRFTRAVDVAHQLNDTLHTLPTFRIA